MDSMAGALMKAKRKSENLAAVIVGADRVAENGDTANKIGTYNLALLARSHGLKFLVAAPRTTIDLNVASGSEIRIEERPLREITHLKGPCVYQDEHGIDVKTEEVAEFQIAPDGTEAWNPAFDITPANFIDAIITEHGVIEKDRHGQYHLSASAPVKMSSKNPHIPDDRISWNQVFKLKTEEVPRWDAWLNMSGVNEIIDSIKLNYWNPPTTTFRRRGIEHSRTKSHRSNLSLDDRRSLKPEPVFLRQRSGSDPRRNTVMSNSSDDRKSTAASSTSENARSSTATSVSDDWFSSNSADGGSRSSLSVHAPKAYTDTDSELQADESHSSQYLLAPKAYTNDRTRAQVKDSHSSQYILAPKAYKG